MSGPKVIDVVTRQQVIDICKAAIAEVNHALAEWQRIMDRNMILAPAELKRLTMARDALQSMLARDQFLDIQKAAPEVTAAIERSVQEQLAGHASGAAGQQRQEQSLRLSARAVLSRMRELAVEVPEDCLRVMSEAAAEQAVDHEALRQSLAQANAALYAKDDSSPSESQHELARILGATGKATSASDALRNAEYSLLDPRVSRVASQISDLAGIGEVDTASLFRSRLDKVNQADTAGDTQQKELLLASLEIDIAPAVRKARQSSALRHDIGVESAAAQATNDWEACRVDLREAESALQRGDTDSARLHIERAKTTRLDRRKQRAAQSSRAAILDGLKELGYEVREGMATQWAEKKQLVVRHAAKPGVALELAGTLDGGRLQARMVALQGAARDPHGDKQTEETWCSEFDSLQKYVARRGGEIRVVKSVAAGAAPLKVVLDDQFEDAKREQLLRERKLP
jgi:hypothetical protein